MPQRWWGILVALAFAVARRCLGPGAPGFGPGHERADGGGGAGSHNRGDRHQDRGPDGSGRALRPQRAGGDGCPRGAGDRIQATRAHRPKRDADRRDRSRARHLQAGRGGGDRPIDRHRTAEPAQRGRDGERQRAHPGADRHHRERAAGQDPGRPDPGELGRARRRHAGQPARRLDDQRQRRPHLGHRRDRRQQRGHPQRRQRGHRRPRRAATRATRTTRPTASPTSTPRTSSGSRC